MTTTILRDTLLALLYGDRELHDQLCATGLIPDDDEALLGEHVETARVVGTLVHELEINWPGVEVILRLRSEILATRRQVGELLGALKQRGSR